ncbi:MAG: 16S rRNA (uracil(1498)-N(3))-methyltransferase [Pontibacterium sp.]
MNLILLFSEDFLTDNTVCLSDRRFHHIRTVQQPAPGDRLRVGLLNGKRGSGLIIQLTDREIQLQVTLDQDCPKPLPATLLLALPRPKMLKRTLQTVAAMGVKELYLINACRVDKSYWSSPLLHADKIHEQLLLGLEQAGDTQLPRVHLRKRFKPFVEDELPAIARNSRALVAHPYQANPCPGESDQTTTLAIGPEGGFIPYEVDKLKNCGFEAVHIGERILRVENAVPVLLARLFPL